MEFATVVTSAEREADRVLDQFADGGGFFDRRTAAGESEELLGQITRAQRSVFRVVQPRCHFVVGWEKQ
jgi:hypothetical protein